MKRWFNQGYTRKAGCGRKRVNPEAVENLEEWILSETKNAGRKITRNQIKAKALQIFNSDTFKASKMWMDKFLNQNDIKFKVQKILFQQGNLSKLQEVKFKQLEQEREKQKQESLETKRNNEDDQENIPTQIDQKQEPECQGYVSNFIIDKSFGWEDSDNDDLKFEFQKEELQNYSRVLDEPKIEYWDYEDLFFSYINIKIFLMLNQEPEECKEMVSSNHLDEIINFDQYVDDEEQEINNNIINQQQAPLRLNFAEILEKERRKTEIVNFKDDDEIDNVAHFGSLNRDEEFPSWKEEKPNEQEPQQFHQISAMTERQVSESPIPILFQPNGLCQMKEFLSKPIGENHIVQCTLIKDKSGTNRFHPKFLLYLSEIKLFLCAAKKQPFNQQIHYVVSLQQDKFERKHSSCLGKIKGNKGIFKLFDPGNNPNDTKYLDTVRKELCLVSFSKSSIQSGLIRQSIIIPRVIDGQQCHEFKPLNDNDGLMRAYNSLEFKNKITHLVNKPATYNKDKNKYQLQFNDRVTEASVKNCIIIDINNSDKSKYILQFGKCAKQTYSIDICYPLSILQGLAICIAQFERKA